MKINSLISFLNIFFLINKKTWFCSRLCLLIVCHHFNEMTAEIIPSPNENREKEMDFMLGTYEKGKQRISKKTTAVSENFSKNILIFVYFSFLKVRLNHWDINIVLTSINFVCRILPCRSLKKYFTKKNDFLSYWKIKYEKL